MSEPTQESSQTEQTNQPSGWKEKVFEPVSVHTSTIQVLFDVYQQECFTERPAEFFCLELCGEAGELANLEKKLWKGREIDTDDIADEAADVLIALMNYVNARGINLSEAVQKKLERIDKKREELLKDGKNY